MTGKKQKAAAPDSPKAAMVPGRTEFPNLTVRDIDVPEEQAVTMLDYEGTPVVTYSVVDKRAKRSRGAS